MKRINYLIIILMLVLPLAGCRGSRKDISISPYIMANVEGLSGRAEATVYLDTAGLYSALAGKDASDEERAEYEQFIRSMTVSADRLSGLANGDSMTITVTYDATLAETLKLDIEGAVKTLEVSGLNEGYEIDVFKDLEVIVSGTAPYAFVTLSNKSDDPYIRNLEYVVEGAANNLKNGDVITVRCMLDEETAELYYYYTDVTTMNYTVEGLDSYIYSADDLDTAALCEIADECAGVIRSETEDTTTRMLYTLTGDTNYLYQDNNEWVEKLKLNQVIFYSAQNQGTSTYENVICFIFETVIANTNYYEDGFFIFEYTNAVCTGEGKFMIGRNNPELRYVCGTDFDEILATVTREIGYQYNSVLVDGIILSESSVE